MTVSESSMLKNLAASVLGSTIPLQHSTRLVTVSPNMKVNCVYYFNIISSELHILSEYLKIKKNVTDEGSAQHVYEVTGCKPGCTMPRYGAKIKEKVTWSNVSSVSQNYVLFQEEQVI